MGAILKLLRHSALLLQCTLFACITALNQQQLFLRNQQQMLQLRPQQRHGHATLCTGSAPGLPPRRAELGNLQASESWQGSVSVRMSPSASACGGTWNQLLAETSVGFGDDRQKFISSADLADLLRSTWYLQNHAMILRRALQVATASHDGQKRKNGEPFIIHPIETAKILADLKMDLDTIVAGLLHDTVEDTALNLQDVEHLFGPSVANIVKGDSKVSKLDEDVAALAPEERRELNHRNMLLAMGADWRVVVVKLADRLHNMRTLQFMPRHKQVQIARETIEIFVPLARRLGISQLEYELLHHSVEYLFPQELLGLFGLELLGHWARLQCWGVLDDFLVRDQVLSELDVNTQLSSHRERWVQHVNYWGVAFAK